MISIIIPVYNVELYLRKCIDSILRQTYADYEVILIDDGSTDSSGRICDSYQSDTRFKIIHQVNEGVSVARNKGLDAATGEFILFVDPDDWIADNALEILMREVEDADLVMFNNFEVYEDNKHEMIILEYEKDPKHGKVQDPFLEILGKSAMMCNKFYKLSTIGDIRFSKNIAYGEDACFVAEILHKVHIAKIIPDYLYYYFINRNGSVTSAPIDVRSIGFLKATRRIFEICSQNYCPAAGIKRINIAVYIVLSKIPLTICEIRNKKKYIYACELLLKTPSCYDYLRYFADKRISFLEKKATLLLFLGKYYLYLRLLKHTIIK